MYSSETFGRLFWVDDNYEFKSCPLNVDGTGDFDCEDYVSEWTEWEGVDMNLLFAIHKCELLNKTQYAGSLTLNDKAHKVIDKKDDYNDKVDTLVSKMKVTNKEEDSMIRYKWDEQFYNEIVKDWNYRFPKFSYIEYPQITKRGV